MLEPLDGELFGEELLNAQYSMVYCLSVAHRLKARVQHLFDSMRPMCLAKLPVYL